jgi:Ras-related protein Rab-2A
MNSNSRSSVAFSVNAKLSFRIIVVGDSSVGKTSLVVKYVKGIFNKNYTVSLGVEFYSKLVNVDNEEIVLQIWDTVDMLLHRPDSKTSDPS